MMTTDENIANRPMIIQYGGGREGVVIHRKIVWLPNFFLLRQDGYLVTYAYAHYFRNVTTIFYIYISVFLFWCDLVAYTVDFCYLFL